MKGRDRDGATGSGDPKLLAAIFDASARGWVESRLGGLGGVYAHPQTSYELTSLGLREAES